MPHFDEFYAGKLRGTLGVAEAEDVLDLRGLGRGDAKAALRRMLENGAPGSAVAVRLTPPAPGGGETLFQPVGRQLLEARRAGLIAQLQTLPSQDGLGFFLVLAGTKQDEPKPS